MSKHTPGPWSVFSTYAETEIRGPQESGAMIARIAPWGEFADEPNPQFANARLIAAAPELLAIVKQLALLTDEGDDQIKGATYIDHRHGVVRAKGSLLETIEQARAAIAKATGETA